MSNSDQFSGFGDGDAPYDTAPPQSPRRLAPKVPFHKKYLVPLLGGVLFFCVGIGVVYYKVFLLPQQENSYATLQPARSVPPVGQTVAQERRTAPQSAPLLREQSNALPLEMMPPQPQIPVPQNDELKSTLEALGNEVKEIRLTLAQMQALGGQPAVMEGAQDSVALTKMVGDMTADLRAQAEANKQLSEALKASERKIDELTRELSRAPESNEGKTAKKNTPTSSSKNSEAGDKSKIKDWKVLGLSANRVVIQGKGGKIYNVGQGETLEGVKINSVDLESGNIKTTAGTLVYGR